MAGRFSRVPLLVERVYNGAEEDLQDQISPEELCGGWALECAFPKVIPCVPCNQ